MTTAASRFKLILLLCAYVMARLPSAAFAQQDQGIQPESLESGFILLVNDATGKANAQSPIHLASSHNGWNPNNPNQVLTQRSDGKWQIVLPKPKLDSRMAFKFTRGSWETVETDADLHDIENRTLPLLQAGQVVAGQAPIIELTIQNWRDARPNEPALLALDPYRPIRVSAGSIKRLQVVGGGVPMTRDLLVWLPPGYDDPANANVRYPVLYMQDGQNLFEKLPTIPAEWGVDETAAELIRAQQMRPIIVVGVPNAADARSIEYLPVPLFENTPANGDQYADFLVFEVIPRINAAFRTLSGPQYTTIGGSSFGAVAALNAAMRHPEAFGAVLLESTPLLSKDRLLMKYFASQDDWPHVIYMGMGDHEAGFASDSVGNNRAYADSLGELERLAEEKLDHNGRVKAVLGKDQSHNEQAWAARLGEALKFLFPPAR